jgi:hypothetical protein
MIKWMIKAHPTQNRMARQATAHRHPSATSAGTARLEGVRSWRWTSGLAGRSSDLDQLISASMETTLRKAVPPVSGSWCTSMTPDS